MRFITLLVLIVGLSSVSTFAENSDRASQRVADLQTQLLEAQNKEAELQARLRQLEEEMKPENIARSLAGVGSTRPEELREYKRRQFEIEKQGIVRQLNLVVSNRERLESALSVAQADAYQKSAEASPVTQLLQTNSAIGWRIAGVGTVIAALGFFAVAAFRKYSLR